MMMADEKKEIVVYTDGACEPNPGAGGYGVVLLFEKRRKEVSGGFRLTTAHTPRIEYHSRAADQSTPGGGACCFR
jgi:ribonuclease HI